LQTADHRDDPPAKVRRIARGRPTCRGHRKMPVCPIE
jgi:hypothetical protein